MSAKKVRDIKNKCDNESEYLKKIVTDIKYQNLIRETKEKLTLILIKMRDSLLIDLETALSDGVYTGNIGIDNPIDKIKYLLSPDSTIREKVAAISNTIYDAVNEKPIIENARKLYHYIMVNKGKDGVKDVYQKIQQVTKNKTPENLEYMNIEEKYENIPLLWCPLLYAFPGYAFKRSNINLHSLVASVKTKNLKKSHLIEKLSDREILFLESKGIDVSKDDLPIETGMNLYGDLVNDLNYYNYEQDMCHVAGISGHSILHFTLGKIFGIDYRFILMGQLLEMTPMHHSMTEICWAANDMGYLELFDNYADMRKNLDDIINSFTEDINMFYTDRVKVKGGTINKKNKKIK
jgi:hypothetical protein